MTNWTDTRNGGVILCHGDGTYLARPKGVGMNRILGFHSYADAIAYADGPKDQWSGWGPCSVKGTIAAT
jgi:hypothetical protein